MHKLLSLLIICLVLVLVTSCNKQKEETISVLSWTSAHDYYLESLTKSIAYLDTLQTLGHKNERAKMLFASARAEFKKAEPFASYLNPEVGHRANGPALPVFLDDSGRILQPIGLQKIEEAVYGEDIVDAEFKEEVKLTKGLMIILKGDVEKRELTPQRFFIATHQQLLRIISLGISGFDTPVSHLGIDESVISLKSLLKVYESSIQFIIKEKNPELDKDFTKEIAAAIAFIQKNMDFATFDRYSFIREHMNPITSDWVKIRKESELWEGIDSEPFNFDAATFFDEDAFNMNFFTSAVNRNPTQKQIELGKKLFFEPNLSADGRMACASCHQPEKAYTDGFALNSDNVGNSLQRNTPTLINVGFQQSFFLDGRSQNLIDQISSVFTNEKEFNSNVHKFSNDILKDTTYIKFFKEAFGGMSARNTDVIKAISSYISTLNGFNSKFDKNIRSDEDTFTEQEKLGFNLYMGKALCATCHFIPLTNGTVPPFYKETEKEIIGVPNKSDNKELDDDIGFYWKFESPMHKGMFKTVTVRNAALTAPYMHNGVYQTLEEVLNFYNLGGGAGMGFELEYQTLPFDELNLTDEEQQAIIAFIKTLNDTEVEVY